MNKESFFLFSFVVVLACLPFVKALSCSSQASCLSVTLDYNYVACQQEVCQCRTDLGFSGNATTSDKCKCNYQVYGGAGGPYCKQCSAPRIIMYDYQGIPRCAYLPECETLGYKDDIAEIRKGVVTNLYQKLIYPNPLPIIATMNVAGIFAQNVTGRITPVGNFNNIEGAVEYFFALAANPFKTVTNVYLIELSSQDDLVWVRVDITFNDSFTGIKRNATQTGFFRFNGDNLIQSFDLANLRQGNFGDVPASLDLPQIQATCSTVMTYCPSVSPQYASFGDCVTFMQSIPFGSWHDGHSNTVVCRILHSLLIPIRPAIHCPHSGPSGGGKCIDFTYESWYNEYF